jgi:hypothetical protein
MIAVTKPLFKPGKVVATPGALEALEQAGQCVWEFVTRHLAGDWGVVNAGDKAANEESVKDGSRILSAYILSTGKKIWLLTEAQDDAGNRATSTFLFPEEY